MKYRFLKLKFNIIGECYRRGYKMHSKRVSNQRRGYNTNVPVSIPFMKIPWIAKEASRKPPSLMKFSPRCVLS